MAKEYLDFYAETALVAENSFIHAVSDRSPVPSLNDVRTRLPQPFWDGPRGADAVACYWRTWEIAFGNLRSATPSFGVAPYIDTAVRVWGGCGLLCLCTAPRRVWAGVDCRV